MKSLLKYTAAAGLILVLGLVVGSLLLSRKQPPLAELSVESIQHIDDAAIKVSVEKYDQPGRVWHYVEITLKDDPTWGDASDWNRVAGKVSKLTQAMFGGKFQGRSRIAFSSPQNNGKEWAVVFVDTSQFPDNWRDLTYLQLFSRTDAMGSSLQTDQWKCAFQRKYPSAAPLGGNAKEWCDKYAPPG
jgi:hypothetical protein